MVGELAKAPIWVDDSTGLTPLDLRDAPPLAVSEVNLVRSDLLPTGPRYSTLVSARLRSG